MITRVAGQRKAHKTSPHFVLAIVAIRGCRFVAAAHNLGRVADEAANETDP